jgi:hypothetical protein
MPREDSTMNSQPTSIAIPFPDATERHLHIRVGACRLRIARGSGVAWVEGTYEDPTGTVRSRVSEEGGTARITQEPHLGSLLGLGRGVPTFDLALGTAHAYTLTIETGASDTEFELGGLPLTRLAIKLGAGKSVLHFLEPNPEMMRVLDLDVGAGNMEVHGLANANFADMTLDGGAAAVTCEFGGTLRHDASARLNTGMSSLEIAVPAATAARIMVDATLGSLQTEDGLTTREGGYWTQAAIHGDGPVLTIHANVALGLLRLKVA